MKFVIQRVLSSQVKVENEIVGSIDKGLLVLIGVDREDTKEVADKMVRKLLNMRIFDDENGKTNLDLAAVNGGLLLISQFTLSADCKHGNRPSFTDAAGPEKAEALYEYIIDKCRTTTDFRVETGAFGAHMEVSLLNDGPFTIILDSEKL